MTVANRRNARRGPVGRDQITSGLYDGTRILFVEGELDKIVIQNNPPSGTTELRKEDSPIYQFWEEEINWTGDFTYMGELTERARKTHTLMIWFEFYCWPKIEDAKAEMDSEGLTDAAKRRATKYALISWGFPVANAQAIANAYINNGTKPAVGDFGMTAMPRWARRLALTELVPDVDDI